MSELTEIVISGGIHLEGDIQISGSKNSAIPCISAALLTSDAVTLTNIPNIRDIHTMQEILDAIGVNTHFDSAKGKFTIKADSQLNEIPDSMSKTIRGSTMLMGSILAKKRSFKISGFGGCAIGKRPIDLHLESFRAMGATVKEGQEVIEVSVETIRPATIILDFPSVGATVNSILASSLSEGTTTITNAAIEPEIIDMIHVLTKMGLSVDVNPHHRVIKVLGTKSLSGITHQIIPDRIEAGTYAVAAAITNGNLLLRGVMREHIQAFLFLLRLYAVFHYCI